jgi:hypothetical protein
MRVILKGTKLDLNYSEKIITTSKEINLNNITTNKDFYQFLNENFPLLEKIKFSIFNNGKIIKSSLEPISMIPNTIIEIKELTIAGKVNIFINFNIIYYRVVSVRF